MLENLERDITGVILVGGKSSRMGRDKAFLSVAGRPLFERILELFRESFAQVVLVGNRKERFVSYGDPVWPDIYPGSSLGGLYTGLHHAATDDIFVSSCDIPFPNAQVLRYLCSLRDGFDAVVLSTTHGYEPLFALYSKNCLAPIREQLDSGDFRAFAFYPRVRVRYVSSREVATFDKVETALLNINTPEDFSKLGGGP